MARGSLVPTEGIAICNIHSHVPYQMQRARCFSDMEISLVRHSALVTPRADQTNEFMQTIHKNADDTEGRVNGRKGGGI